jgi:hypothetical protein
MKRFLWIISIGVCVAGLLYHFSGTANAPRPGADAASKTVSETISQDSGNAVFRENHLANCRLLSSSIRGYCTFWYFTPADQGVSDYILYGVLPAPGTVFNADIAPLKADRMGASRYGAAMEARARPDGVAEPDGVRDTSVIGKKN